MRSRACGRGWQRSYIEISGLVGKLKEWIAYRHLSVSLFEWGKEKRKRR